MLLAVAPLGVPAHAGSFQVDPVVVELRTGQRASALTVRNREQEPVSIQVRLYRWTQENGEDVYSEAPDLIASPPMFTMRGGGTQLVRIGPRGRALSGAYRVILEEVPRGDGASTGIRVALRINLPLYVVSPGAAGPDLTWSAWRTSDGEVIVEAANAGSRHSQILEIAAVEGSGRRTVLSSEMGVVLPMSAKRWNVGRRPELRSGESLKLITRNGSGETSDNRIALDQR